MDRADLQRRLRALERLGVAALLCAALVPRARDLGAGFDREHEGELGSALAIAAVHYARHGVAASRGYPSAAIDGPAGELVDARRPPAVPLLAWLWLEVVGPAGWDDAWREHRAPEGVEPALRAPFLALHLVGAWALWWALRAGHGAGTAMIALALWGTAPVAILYGSLAHHENVVLPCVLLAFGAAARWAAIGSRRWLVAVGGAFLAGGCADWTAALFLPPLVAAELGARGAGRAARLAAAGGAGVLLPLALHALAAPGAPVAPAVLPDVAAGAWLAAQAASLAGSFGPALLAAGVAGLALRAARAVAPGIDRRLARLEVGGSAPRVELALPLAGAAALVLFVLDTSPAAEPRRYLLLLVAPALVAGAAALLGHAAVPLFRLRAGIAPMVALVGAVALPGLARAAELRARHRAPPLPAVTGAELAALLPPGEVGRVPRSVEPGGAAAFYAWRTVIARTEGDEGRVLLPRDPPPAAREEVEALRSRLGAPLAETAHWSAHRPSGDADR